MRVNQLWNELSAAPQQSRVEVWIGDERAEIEEVITDPSVTAIVIRTMHRRGENVRLVRTVDVSVNL